MLYLYLKVDINKKRAMNLIDTHTHIYLHEEFDGTNAEVVKRGIDAGVSHMVFPNVDLSTIEPMMKLHNQFPNNTSVAIGLHPTEIKENWKDDLMTIQNFLNKGNFIAIGEIGIDMYWDKTFRDKQMQALDIQLHWAEEKKLPAILHCRDGLDEIIEVISSYSGNVPSLLFHSFSGSIHDIEKLRQYGDFYFGINGVVTFKNAQTLRDALPSIGLNRILLETDSPYLAPVPHRGKRNESAYLPLVATKIAETLNEPIEKVASTTTANAIQFFHLSNKL